nr:immunoglobulin heavy chain junction region [Macaca mulatta]
CARDNVWYSGTYEPLDSW